MEDKVIKCFVNSAVNVLGAELGCAVTVGEPTVEETEYVANGVTGTVGVTGNLRGMVVFGLTESTALALISHMMGMPYEKLDSMAQSGIAELGNVIAGSAVTSLTRLGYQCGITPPAVVIGEKSIATMLNHERTLLPIETQFGTLDMQVMLRENAQH